MKVARVLGREILLLETKGQALKRAYRDLIKERMAEAGIREREGYPIYEHYDGIFKDLEIYQEEPSDRGVIEIEYEKVAKKIGEILRAIWYGTDKNGRAKCRNDSVISMAESQNGKGRSARS